MNQQLLKILTQNKLLNETFDSSQKITIESPWYVKVLLAFSGWLAASFMLGFIASFFSQFYKDTPLLIGLGSVLIVTAYFILHNKKVNEFLEHLALAISLAGQVLFLLATLNTFKYSEEMIWLSFGLVQLPLALFMPNFVHRVFSSFFATICFAATIFFLYESIGGFMIYGAFVMLLTALIWLNEFRFPKLIEALHAIGYGLVLALITIKGTNIFMHTNAWNIRVGDYAQDAWFNGWIGELLLSGVTLYVVWNLLKKTHPKPSKTAMLLALGGTILLTVLSMQAQGLLTGLMILLLGFSTNNRILLGFGVTALLFFISSYYYLLENTLLDKSITLFILGITLIIGRIIIVKVLPETAAKGESA